jgi:hypothetical protein
MREIRTSGSMRGGRKRAFAWRACLLLYRAPNSLSVFQNDPLSRFRLIQLIDNRHWPRFHSHSGGRHDRCPVHDVIHWLGRCYLRVGLRLRIAPVDP